MKKLFLILFAFISFSYVLGQAEADKNYLVSTVAFYNVENLFDTINDPLTWDDDRTPEGKDKWTNTIYNKNTFSELIELINQHFNKSKLPIIIDNGVYSYCLTKFNDSSNEFILLDPHTTTNKDTTKIIDTIFLQKCFWMLYLPIYK